MDQEIYYNLINRVNYAVKSDSRDRVMEAYGEAVMAKRLRVISNDQYFKINSVLVSYLNCGANGKEKALKHIEETEW